MSNSARAAESARPQSPARSQNPVHKSISGSTKTPRHHHHHHHHHLHRNHEKLPFRQSSQSSVATDIIRSERGTPDQSQNGSRRTSRLGPDSGSEDVTSNRPNRKKKVVKDAELEEEKEKGVLRATELRNALSGLNSLSHDTARRLDNTYYSVLEKLSSLQSTIVSLKELAGMTQHLNEDFKGESEEVVTDVETQLATFEGFEAQQTKIEDLAERVKKGRETIQTLGKRVDTVSGRIERWEMAEMAWKARTRRRLQGLWIIISCFLAGLLGMGAFYYTPSRTNAWGSLDGMNASLKTALPELEKRNATLGVAVDVHETAERIQYAKAPEEQWDDLRLRLLDEL